MSARPALGLSVPSGNPRASRRRGGCPGCLWLPLRFLSRRRRVRASWWPYARASAQARCPRWDLRAVPGAAAPCPQESPTAACGPHQSPRSVTTRHTWEGRAEGVCRRPVIRVLHPDLKPRARFGFVPSPPGISVPNTTDRHARLQGRDVLPGPTVPARRQVRAGVSTAVEPPGTSQPGWHQPARQQGLARGRVTQRPPRPAVSSCRHFPVCSASAMPSGHVAEHWPGAWGLETQPALRPDPHKTPLGPRVGPVPPFACQMQGVPQGTPGSQRKDPGHTVPAWGSAPQPTPPGDTAGGGHSGPRAWVDFGQPVGKPAPAAPCGPAAEGDTTAPWAPDL